MKCFVAMAFSHEDTDKMFESQICQLLTSKGIDVVRVDRIEHNDNIDDRIFAEIQSADFLIADLTYARPSVYFEAGFAERCIPVVYTARRDHFGHMPEDRHGNFRIHFDVATRNIIDWVDPDDPLFTQRLSSRVDHVTAPILAAKNNVDRTNERRKAFLALSPKERENVVGKAVRDKLKSLRFLDADAMRAAGLESARYYREDWYRMARTSPCSCINRATTPSSCRVLPARIGAVRQAGAQLGDDLGRDLASSSVQSGQYRVANNVLAGSRPKLGALTAFEEAIIHLARGGQHDFEQLDGLVPKGVDRGLKLHVLEGARLSVLAPA